MGRRHHDLRVWQEAMELVKQIYQLTAGFPNDERYGLTSQMRRSSISIASNIAEGAGRSSKREMIQFLMIARGSLAELETQLLLAKELDLCSSNSMILGRVDKIFGLLGGLVQSLRFRVNA